MSGRVLVRGEALFEDVAGVHLPITGALEYLRGQGHALRPLLWCSATPKRACDRRGVRAYLPACCSRRSEPRCRWTGCILDLHGAMVCEHLEDGEGEILGRVRSLIGPDVPLVASSGLACQRDARDDGAR